MGARAASSWRPGQLRRIPAAMDVVDTAEDAAELQRPPLLVREPLEEFLDAHDIGEGRLEAERIGDGHSNITFLVTRGDARVVLRRPPRPPLPPSAHDVLREALLLRALERTAVRVQQERLAQHVVCRGRQRRASQDLVDALIEVHATDWQACGLEGFGKPTGYLARQVRRFTGLWEH